MKRRLSEGFRARRVRAATVSAVVALGMVALGVVACGSEAGTDESGEPTEVLSPPPVAEPPPPPPPDRAPDGALLESDDYVVGLRLPRGLTEVAFHERQHYYEGLYAPEAYVRYFGPRLLTGNVERLSNGGARYVEATPREARGAVIHVDVSISPGSRTPTVVTIAERPPAPETPPPEAETLEALRRALEHSE